MSLLASIPRTYPASLLLNFDGANNSTTFTDSSSYNHTGTVYETAKISTAQSKFDGSSGYFDSSGDYIQYSTNTAFGFGTGSFTIEFWLYMISEGGTQGIISIGDYTNGILFRHQPTTDSFYINGTSYNWYSSTNCPISQWNHIAITRENGNFSIYVNGFKILSGYNNSDLGATRNVTIGASSHSTTEGLNGYVDSLRITKGVALYTGQSFVLPSSPPSKNATIAPKLYNHIVMTSTKSSGNITGYISTSTGYYTVNYWDGTKTTYVSGANFAKAAIGGNQSITIYPSSSNGSLDGYFYNVDVSNNNLTSVRPFYSRFIVGPATPGYSQYGYVSYPYYYSRWTYIPGIPGVEYHLDVSSNLLDSSSLNQIYTDLLNGDGTIEVSDNTGGDSDNPSIATAKGYTVYGSVAPYTTLLLNLNSNYTDSSSQNIAVSGLGGSPAFSTSIKKYGSAALSCNGGNVGNSSFVIPDLSQVDYTIEFWIYRPTATAAYEGVINLSNGSTAVGVNVHLYTSNEIQFNNGSAASAYGGTINATGWYHVACVSDNNVKKLFIDGILINSNTQATPAGPYKLKIGATYGEALTSNAYIDDVRIIRGKALYNNDFVPPTSELTTSVSSVSFGATHLLLNFNGSNNGTTFTDSSSNNLTATRNGNTIISTTESKFGSSSAYFDGTGDYLTFSGTNFNLTSSDFTIEAWIRPSSVTGARGIFSKRANIGTYGGLVFFVNGNLLGFSATNNGYSWGVDFNSGSSTLSINTWYHVAVTRNNDTFRLFLNGTQVGSQIIENFVILNNSNNIAIGAGGAGGIGNQEFLGYIDDLRVIRGKSIYNYNFTPPASQLTVYP